MNCPVCDNELTPAKAGTVTVDVCLGGCGGIWFDNFELHKLDEPHELDGNLLVNVKRREDLHIDHDRRRNCPKCQSIVMMRHYFSPLRRVEVDECPQCGGYWLDAGELAAVREERQTEQQRRAAVEQYFAEMTEQSLSSLRRSAQGQSEQTVRINRVLRFSVPIQYRVEGNRQ